MISFIVPAYNEEAELPGTLRAIHSAAIGYEYEIVLVNDGSTDATAAIGERLGRFKLLREAANTSGRKLRMYSGWKISGGLFSVLFGGPRGVMSRKKLDMWYGGEREKPVS